MPEKSPAPYGRMVDKRAERASSTQGGKMDVVGLAMISWEKITNKAPKKIKYEEAEITKRPSFPIDSHSAAMTGNRAIVANRKM